MDDEAPWCFTAGRLTLMGMDARAFLPFPLLLLHISIFTLVVTLTAIAVFWLLERRGYSVQVCLRVLRLRGGGLMRWPIVVSRPRPMAERFDYF